jgi:hypothetical protein
VAPRASFTWTLGKTNVRGGWGLFYDWFTSNTYEQTVRLDGTHQIEEVIIDPAFPDPSTSAGTRLPASIIRAAGHLTQPTIQQASIGFDRNVTDWMGIRTDYMWTRGRSMLRSVNVNAPDAAGVRPDPSVGNISEIQSTARAAQDRVTVGVSLGSASRRIFSHAVYQWSHARNDADSPLSLPADSRDADADWGPAAQDIRHRILLIASVPLGLGVRGAFNVEGSSSLPYTITTGRDDNGDTVFTDRPDGVGRNSARGAAQWDVTLRLNRSFSLGGVPPDRAQRGPGVGGGEGGPQTVMPALSARRRLDLSLQAFNLLNHTNLNTFVGNRLSPAFGRATSAAPARRLEVGASLSF